MAGGLLVIGNVGGPPTPSPRRAQAAAYGLVRSLAAQRIKAGIVNITERDGSVSGWAVRVPSRAVGSEHLVSSIDAELAEHGAIARRIDLGNEQLILFTVA